MATAERTTVKRLPERGRYDRETVDAILDEALVCHVGLVTDHGPVVIPTTHARNGDVLYVHGSPASNLLRTAKRGGDVCVTVTLIDGLVLARSAFHHSVNYRSVVVFGTATVVEGEDEKAMALEHLVEHVVPGRSAEARAPTAKELAGTLVLSLPLTEASAKVRTGPPVDDEEDLALPVWAGVLPLTTVAGIALADPDLPEDIPIPDYVRRYSRAPQPD